MSNKKIRMADIAAELDVSIVSVSKALSGKDGVSEDTRQKILARAKELGYTVPTAKKEEPKASGNIGILVADRFFADNAFYSNLYRAILMKSSAVGYYSLLEIVSPQQEENCEMPALIKGNKVDGIIFMGEINRNYLRAITQTGLPFMLLDFFDEELHADCVISDSVAGGYTLTNHILSTGRTKIGFVGSIFSTSSIMDRYLGYTKALMRKGLEVRGDWRLEDRDANGKFVAIKLPSDMPEAFICSCDEVAYNLTEHLKRNGYNVPMDVAVAGYDDYRFAQLCEPQLSTYRVNIDGMGNAVVSQIVRKIRGKREFGGTIVINGKFVRRQST